MDSHNKILSALSDVVVGSLSGDDTESDDDVEEYIEKMKFLFSENLLLAALDLVDRESVIKYVTPWGHSSYHVLGSTTTYIIFPGSNENGLKVSPYCTCPAFAYSVLLSESEVMCKHLLATRIAIRFSRLLERPVTRNDLADLSFRRRC
ncbi:hypothetical protein QCA50_017310 [Cerrena zonata]|uniref:SWIM-type domain-containing protein n=1 Tax=Cerrena zonata TaxID=2478898 RepID=A0AAW0FMW9_9APHY